MISPAEVFMVLTRSLVSDQIVPHVVVGPLSHDQQQVGGLSIMDAGDAAGGGYSLLVRPRFQVRVIHPALETIERMARYAAFAVDAVDRRVLVTQPSTGETFLVHSCTVNGGPSMHRDTEGTWEGLFFAEPLMGTVPVTP